MILPRSLHLHPPPAYKLQSWLHQCCPHLCMVLPRSLKLYPPPAYKLQSCPNLCMILPRSLHLHPPPAYKLQSWLHQCCPHLCMVLPRSLKLYPPPAYKLQSCPHLCMVLPRSLKPHHLPVCQKLKLLHTLAAEFDLSRFLFKQNEIGKKTANEKTKPERTKKEEKRDLTKPEKILQFLTNPISKVYSLFLKRAIPIFDIGNQVLQKEEPCIHVLLPTLEMQLEKVLLSFCKPEHVITMMNEIGRGIKPTITRENQLPDEELSIGHDTQTFIQSQGNLDLKPFFRDVRKFFSSAADYMVSKYPFGDELLKHAVVADIAKRQFVKFCSLRFFICRFPSVLTEEVTVDQVEDEFRMYQTTSFDDSILNKRIDEAWRDIGLLKRGGKEIFSKLSVVMLGILVIFHSNADCERVFSLVTKNKTQYRASLSTDMISALVTRKVSMAAKGTVCHMESFSDALLKKAKSASYETKQSRASSTASRGDE